jgi:hypothetical protein
MRSDTARGIACAYSVSVFFLLRLASGTLDKLSGDLSAEEAIAQRPPATEIGGVRRRIHPVQSLGSVSAGLNG